MKNHHYLEIRRECLEPVRVVGVTGGIGSGKTTFSRMLARFGALHLDADEIARDVTRPGEEGYERVVQSFGDIVLTQDGFIDRRVLGDLVFRDPDARRRLESLLHPLITARVREIMSRHRGRVVYEAALLLESGHQGYVDCVVVVTAPEEVRASRVMERSRLSPEQALAIIRSQKNDSWRIGQADLVVHNVGTVESLDETSLEVAELVGWHSIPA